MAELWNELHIRALNHKAAQDSEYLKEFKKRIPRYTKGCSCKEFWGKWIQGHPPVFGNNGEYFAWTVKAHNAVNAKLNKKQYTLEEAKKFYSSK